MITSEPRGMLAPGMLAPPDGVCESTKPTLRAVCRLLLEREHLEPGVRRAGPLPGSAPSPVTSGTAGLLRRTPGRSRRSAERCRRTRARSRATAPVHDAACRLVRRNVDDRDLQSLLVERASCVSELLADHVRHGCRLGQRRRRGLRAVVVGAGVAVSATFSLTDDPSATSSPAEGSARSLFPAPDRKARRRD